MGFLSSSLCLLAFTSTAISQAVPVLPSKDPWYTPPSGFEFSSPGEVLRVRFAPGNLTTTFGNASAVYDILFHSTDTNYQPTWGFTAVFIPKKTRGNAPLSYQIPYNTPDVDAGRTTLLYGSKASQGLIYSDIDTALLRGWYVNVPDHEGPHASFFCGVQEGHAILDSIRAVLHQFGGWSLAAKPKVALWGYSGGSVASEFVAELQVQYAPELEIAGVAIGGVASNTTNSIPKVLNGPFAGLTPAILLGFATQHSDFSRYLFSHLKTSGPYNATGFLAVRNLSIEQAFAVYANQDMTTYFTNGRGLFDSPILLDVVAKDAIMGAHSVPQVPMYMYKAVHDEVTPIADTDSMVSQYCRYRANIVYEKNSIGGHVAEETNGDARALGWLGSVFEGTYNHTGCTERTVAINVTDSTL